MGNRFLGSSLAGSTFAAVAVLAFSSVLLAQSAQQSGVAKAQTQTAASTPDLSGVWSARTYRSVNPTEPPPFQPWAAEQFKTIRMGTLDEKDKGRDDMDPILLHCAPAGLTRIMVFPRPFEIIQIPGRVLMIFEWDHWVRQIWMDGREHPEDPDPSWMGHSIGSWDGDTLVVDTVGLMGDNKTWLDSMGHMHTDAMHVVERIRRVAQDSLEVEYTFDDPKAYTKLWKGKLGFQLRPGWEITEMVNCENRTLYGEAFLEGE